MRKIIRSMGFVRDRGMALVSVLMVTVVMLGLAGAFFIAHKSDLALMTSSTYREQTKNACFSLAEFVQYKLQNDRKFGQSAFSSDGRLPAPESFPPGSAEPTLEVEYLGNGASPLKNRLVGRLPESGVEFEVILLNNLDNTAYSGVAGKPETPPRTARAWITSRRGNLTQHVDLILKRSPFTNSSMTSGGSITVDLTDSGGMWWLGSRQPSGNAVRASGSITGPEVWSKTGKSVAFTPPTGMEKQNPPYGVIQGNTLNMRVDGAATVLETDDPRLHEAEENIQGVLISGGGSIKVPELNRDDLQGASRRVDMPASKIVFRTVDGPGGPRQVLEQDGHPVATYNPLDGDLTRRYYHWDDGGTRAATFDLEGRTMTVAENVELRSSDAFSLSAFGAAGNLDEGRQPTLVLGNSTKGSSIDAKGIDIQGSVGGKGALKSKDKHSTLKIAAKSTLSTTPDFGIALHSEGDVVLTKPGLSSSDGLAVDWDAFSKAYDRTGNNTAVDKWYKLGENEKLTAAKSFKERQIANYENKEQFDELWDGLTRDFPADAKAIEVRDKWLKPPVFEVKGPKEDWVPPEVAEGEVPEPAPIVVLTPGVPPGPGVSLENYVRMREYLRTVKSGSPDPTWLESEDSAIQSQRSSDVANKVMNQMSNYQSTAGQISETVGKDQVVLRWQTMGEYLGQPTNPYRVAYAPDMSFRGLVYAGRDFIFDTDHKGIFVEGALVAQGKIEILNATGGNFVYNSDLLENLFATDEEDTSVPLERAFWSFY